MESEAGGCFEEDGFEKELWQGGCRSSEWLDSSERYGA